MTHRTSWRSRTIRGMFHRRASALSEHRAPRRFARALGLAMLCGCGPASPPAERPTAPAAADIDETGMSEEYRELTRGYNDETGARQMSVTELRERIARGDDIVLLDIREPRENAVSALPEARLVPPERVGDAAIEAPTAATVVTYCTAGYRSGKAAVALERRLGRPVFNLDGGIIAWFNAGGEVRDPSGENVDRIDPYGPAWARYVRPRAEAGGESTDRAR